MSMNWLKNISHANAEEIFNQNLGKEILVKLISNDMEVQGKLLKIFCNTFLVETNEGNVEMFRYEDIIFLKVVDNQNEVSSQEVSFMHAIEAYRNHPITIYCIHNGRIHIYPFNSDGLIDKHNRGVHTWEIIDGEWHIGEPSEYLTNLYKEY